MSHKLELILHNTLKPECFGKKASIVCIREKNPDAKVTQIKISEIEKETIILLLDEARKSQNSSCYSCLFKKKITPNRFINNNSVCEAVLIHSINNKHYFIYIELKSDNPYGFEKQFLDTELFIDYIIDKEIPGFSKGRSYFIVFSRKKPFFNKRKTSARNSKNSPKTPAYITNQEEISLKNILEKLNII